MASPIKTVVAFVVDYCQRHAHPLNAVLHIFGVPMAFYGLYDVLTGRFVSGAIFLFFGYLLQYLGHRAQGNEVGEVTLIKNVVRRINNRTETRAAALSDANPQKRSGTNPPVKETNSLGR